MLKNDDACCGCATITTNSNDNNITLAVFSELVDRNVKDDAAINTAIAAWFDHILHPLHQPKTHAKVVVTWTHKNNVCYTFWHPAVFANKKGTVLK